MALIMDTETSGLPDRTNIKFPNNPNYKDIYKYKNCRIVSICIMECDENFINQNINNYIVKIKDFSINNSDFHKITNEISMKDGIDIEIIFEILYKSLKRVSHIIAHNADFDISVLKSELYRKKRDDIIIEIDKKIKICTMLNTKDILKIPNNFGYKYPSLKDLYNYTMNQEITNQHNSYYDVLNLYDSVKKLYIDKKIIIKNLKYIINIKLKCPNYKKIDRILEEIVMTLKTLKKIKI